MRKINSTSLKVGMEVIMRKNHPCGSNMWKIVRYGADVKLMCIKCERIIMLPRHKFLKNIKEITESEKEE